MSKSPDVNGKASPARTPTRRLGGWLSRSNTQESINPPGESGATRKSVSEVESSDAVFSEAEKTVSLPKAQLQPEKRTNMTASNTTKIVEYKGKGAVDQENVHHGRHRSMHQPYSTKTQNFQIRVKVVEARQLQGGNLSPVCKVTCWNRREETHVKNSTNSPYWNEIFFFNFHVSPAELLDQIISFDVFNSRRLRKDAFIGSFKFDLGMAYEQESHSMINKWLLLSNPEDPMAGAKGYLKISIVILGPGDEAPSMNSVNEDVDEDIEANLLRPAGVQLRPAVFKMRLFIAEDLPRMDPDTFKGLKTLISRNDTDNKEFADPYMVWSFAGKTLRSSIKYGTDHPDWNEELTMNLQFPSMCERLKLSFIDWDRASGDDPIGTTNLFITETSALGRDGFLPTFGPCFINLYGSPREYSDLPDRFEALNLGKGEGVAYRGRVLVELLTELLDKPTKDGVKPLNPDVVARIQKSLRRRKFRLSTAFLSASLISEEKDTPVEFEVTIGNYGNKLDESITPCASTTPPTHPVFDGEYYSYLPWGEDKPVTVVDSHWEDISYRLCAINMLLKTADRLARNIEKINVSVVAALSPVEQAKLVITSLDEFIMDCGRVLPQWEPECSPETELDKCLRRLRENELLSLRSQALHTRKTETIVEVALTNLKEYHDTIKSLAADPQQSVPDIIIWMLSGSKRVAYHRIPAHELLYHSNEEYRGRFCGVTQIINLKKPRLNKDDVSENWKIPVQLRLVCWFGLEKDQHAWTAIHNEATVRVMAETFENQASILGQWLTTWPPLTRPAWSDSSGRCELPKEGFVLPDGWQWEGDWSISPVASLIYKKDAKKSAYIEEVFYNESRSASSGWSAEAVPYTNSLGEAVKSPDSFPLIDGWKWDDDWNIDYNRPCDDQGFEYTVNASLGGYVAVEKVFHMFRRRRLIRRRLLFDPAAEAKSEMTKETPSDAWEYAFSFDSEFHVQERRVDMVRRRRWHRLMVPSSKLVAGRSCVMQLQTKEKQLQKNFAVPRVYLRYSTTHTWHLRAYLFQARSLLSADETGLSDPYVRCAFLGMSQRTQTIQATLCPTWDESLLFDSVEIHGDPLTIATCPPPVVLELFDWDQLSPDEYLGRCEVTPFIKLDQDAPFSCILQWHKIEKDSKSGGELLAAFELSLLDGKAPPPPPTRRGTLYNVPEGIRPVLQRTGIEILCWGVRNMRKHYLASVTSPSVEFEIGGQVIESATIKDTHRNPNFLQPLLFLDVQLPKEELYTPPMNIYVRDHRPFGLKPLVGLHVMKTFNQFKVEPQLYKKDHLIEIPALCDYAASSIATETTPLTKEEKKKLKRKLNSHLFADTSSTNMLESSRKGMNWKFTAFSTRKKTALKADMQQVDDDIDWWSKFYASMGQWDKCLKYKEMEYDTLVVYKTPLEDVKEFEKFSDFCNTFTLTKGKNVDDDENNYAGEFKGTFRIYPLPEDPTESLPMRYFDRLSVSPEVEESVIIVYVIRAIDLQPSDSSGLADPYVEVRLGDKKVNSRDNYLPNTLNPEFGARFKLKCVLPIEKDLIISVKDFDLIGTDDVIGETLIDLENRRLTKYRATCGLPQTYNVSGPNQWRDTQLPSQVLADFCDHYDLPAPSYTAPSETNPSWSCRVGQRNFTLTQFERAPPANPHLGPANERLALHILNLLPLVKEHVETRLLYSPLQPNIEQGKLEMWVDIFPAKYGEPAVPVDITPRRPNEYVLRVVVWNTEDVLLQETSITGEQMSDIYVKGWLSGVDERQSTDVHYRSLDGEGNFNWRFVFPFFYLPAENMIAVKRKEHFWSLDITETHVRPILIMQVWDNDLFSADDFIGTLELNLASMPAPAKTASKCTLKMLQPLTAGKDSKTINLFDCRRARGYWPFMNDESGEQLLTGKIEMEFELLTKGESTARPAGIARDEPNENPHLDPPKRPETSFFWLASPWKTFKFIIWKRLKWVLLGLLILLLLIILVFLFVYAFPELLARKMIGV